MKHKRKVLVFLLILTLGINLVCGSSLYKFSDCKATINERTLSHNEFDVNTTLERHEFIKEKILDKISVLRDSVTNFNMNNTTDVDNSSTNNSTVVEENNTTEPVHDYKTIIAYPSSYLDKYYSYQPYYVTWDMTILNSIRGYCEFNPKGVFENEITDMKYDIDYSALTGYEKCEFSWQFSSPKSVASARVSYRPVN